MLTKREGEKKNERKRNQEHREEADRNEQKNLDRKREVWGCVIGKNWIWLLFCFVFFFVGSFVLNLSSSSRQKHSIN